MTLYMPDNMRRRMVAALATMHSRYLGDLFPAYAAFTLRLIPGKFKKVLRVFIQLISTFVVITSCYIFWGFTPRHILDVRRLKTKYQKWDKSVWWFEFLFVKFCALPRETNALTINCLRPSFISAFIFNHIYKYVRTSEMDMDDVFYHILWIATLVHHLDEFPPDEQGYQLEQTIRSARYQNQD